MHTPMFDRDTAKPFNRRPGGSRHTAYQDAAGSICLWAKSDLAGGGCAISASAIKWLDGMPGAHFIRLTNEKGNLDVILRREDVPLDEAREGQHGDYFVVDPDDVQFPPLKAFTGDKAPF